MKSGRSNIARAFVIAMFCAATAPLAHAVGLYVQPANFYLAAPPGAIVEEKINVASSVPNTAVQLSVSGFTMDGQGTPLSCSCPAQRSIELWSTISASSLVLSGIDYEPVTVRISVPASARGSYWGALLIDSDAPAGTLRPVKARVAIPIFITVAGTEAPHIRVSDLRAYAAAEGVFEVTATLTNDGNTLLHTPLVIAVENPLTVPPTELASAEDVVALVLPGMSRTFKVRVGSNVPKRDGLRVTLWLHVGAGALAVVEASGPVLPAPPCSPSGCLDV